MQIFIWLYGNYLFILQPMVNSTIKKKKCKCGKEGECSRFPTMGFDGYFYLHAPEEIKLRQGLKAKRTYQNRLQRQKKTLLSRKLHEADKMVKEGENGQETAVITPQWQWFLDRREELTGFCSCGCGTLSSKKDDKYFHCSIAHILQKSKVKSMALHPLNWIELNFWDGHHSNFDNQSNELWEGMACWDEIVFKFKKMYPEIPDYEKRWIPQILLNQI